MTRPLLAAQLALAAALLLACGGASRTTITTSPSTSPTTATSSPTSTTATAPATSSTPQGGIDTMAGAGTRPVHVTATNKQTALLTAVRAARHEGFDRVVFGFRNVLPGYDVRYVSRPIHQDPSGKG